MEDDSGVSISATLWGSIASDENFEIGNVLVAKGAKVSNYGGKSISLSNDHVKYEINPKN